MKVNWATSPNSKNVTDSTKRVDTSGESNISTTSESINLFLLIFKLYVAIHFYSKSLYLRVSSDHYHVFCGDLSPDIETKQLRDAFMAFGEIS